MKSTQVTVTTSNLTDAMTQVLTEGQSKIRLPTDDKSKHEIAAIRAALKDNHTALKQSSSSASSSNSKETIVTITTAKEDSKTLAKQAPAKTKRRIKPLDLASDIKLPNYLATATNEKLSLFKKTSSPVLAMVADHLTAKDINAFNLTSRKGHMLFQNTLRDEVQPRLQKLLEHVVRGELYEVRELMESHYKIKLHDSDEKQKSDTLYIKAAGRNLQYSITTSEGKSFNDCVITQKEIDNIKQEDIQKTHPLYQYSESEYRNTRHHYARISDLTFYNVLRQSFRPFILAITTKRGHTPPKNNSSLLLMKGQVTDYSGRKIEGTPYQIALGASDVRTCHFDDYKESGWCMAEWIQHYLMMLPNGKKALLSQYDRQFPKDYEIEERKKELYDLQALHRITKAILDAKANNLPAVEKECELALNAFREHYENQKKNVIKTGNYFNMQTFINACDLFFKHYESFGNHPESPKNIYFLQKVIGYINRFFTTCEAQALCRGFFHIVGAGELGQEPYFEGNDYFGDGLSGERRSLTFRNGSRFFPLDSNSSTLLGHNCALLWSGDTDDPSEDPVTSTTKYDLDLTTRRAKKLLWNKKISIAKLLLELDRKQNFSLESKWPNHTYSINALSQLDHHALDLLAFSDALSINLKKGDLLEVYANNTAFTFGSSAKRQKEIAKALIHELKACQASIHASINDSKPESALKAIQSLINAIEYYRQEYALVSTKNDKLSLIFESLNPIIASSTRMLENNLAEEKSMRKKI